MGRLKPDAAALPGPLTLSDAQGYVAALEADRGWDAADAPTCCFRMGEEVGELFGAVRRHPVGSAGAREAVGPELVDVLNYVLAIATRYGIELEAEFRLKNAANERRVWPAPGSASGGAG